MKDIFVNTGVVYILENEKNEKGNIKGTEKKKNDVNIIDQYGIITIFIILLLVIREQGFESFFHTVKV